jgi:hypothetical protein
VERDADDLVPCVVQARGGDGGVDPAAHRHGVLLRVDLLNAVGCGEGAELAVDAPWKRSPAPQPVDDRAADPEVGPPAKRHTPSGVERARSVEKAFPPERPQIVEGDRRGGGAPTDAAPELPCIQVHEIELGVKKGENIGGVDRRRQGLVRRTARLLRWHGQLVPHDRARGDLRQAGSLVR